mgnify:CR=1 FL=1
MAENHEAAAVDIDDFEEWDGVSPFWHHCVAGSTAGLVEHTLVYPIDTVRTHIQVCANCKFSSSYQQAASNGAASAASKTVGGAPLHQHLIKGSAAVKTPSRPGLTSRLPTPASPSPLPQGMWQTMRYLMSEPAVLATDAGTASAEIAAKDVVAPKAEGVMRLWRGVQAVMIGCIPAHAIYFSSYEIVKAKFTSGNGELAWYGGALAGATATLGHDMIMSPLDTVKQRLQIGHYRGSMTYALQQMMKKEGVVALYRSFPVTLFANLPYGMIMVSTNESLKQFWTQSSDGHAKPLTLSTTLMASSAAGLVASALTTPLDRIKTLLQTQQMAPACWPTPPANCPVPVAKVVQAQAQTQAPVIQNAQQALQQILRQEGTVGLFRGVVPRVIQHTPAVAISWTTYETAKSILLKATADH